MNVLRDKSCRIHFIHFSLLLQQIDVNNNTLGDVVTRVIKAKLGFNEPSIMMGSCFLYEEGKHTWQLHMSLILLSYMWKWGVQELENKPQSNVIVSVSFAQVTARTRTCRRTCRWC